MPAIRAFVFVEQVGVIAGVTPELDLHQFGTIDADRGRPGCQPPAKRTRGASEQCLPFQVLPSQFLNLDQVLPRETSNDSSSRVGAQPNDYSHGHNEQGDECEWQVSSHGVQPTHFSFGGW